MTKPTDAEILEALYLIAPQFKTDPIDPAKEADYIKMINLLGCQINERAVECCGALVYALFLAHMLTLAGDPSIGTKSSMSLGDASIGFRISDSALSATSYGLQYKDLIRKFGQACYVTGTRNLGASLKWWGYGPYFLR